MMALLDASENGEASGSSKHTKRKAVATVVHEVAGGDNLDEQRRKRKNRLSTRHMRT
jgi:hypothetical protein